jgi:hypothetical protein
MNRLLVVIVALCLGTGSGCIVEPTPNSNGSLTINNGSTHVLTDIRITPTNSSTWGPNLLPNSLFPDEKVTVTVACDTYDALVDDDFGHECTLTAVDLCFSDASWTIDNTTLRNCAF